MIGISSVTVVQNTDFRPKVDAQCRNNLVRNAEEIAADVSRSLVRRGRTSLPGETPTIHSNELQRIVVTYDASQKAVLVYPQPQSGSTVPEELEFGTGEVEPRPYLRPAFERNISKIVNDWRNAIK